MEGSWHSVSLKIYINAERPVPLTEMSASWNPGIVDSPSSWHEELWDSVYIS